LGGYIIDFAIDCTQSYSVVERDFFKGPCRRFFVYEWKYKEKDPQCNPTEEGSTYHIIIYVKPTTPCATPIFEEETKTLSREIVVRGGSLNINQNS
jgi:hypothetical protein